MFDWILLAVLALIAIAFAAVAWPRLAHHLHLLPATPRSIFDTRRMGLA